jgi:hypothetical protein
MRDERRKSDWLVVLAVCTALLLVPLGLYVGGYYWLANTAETRFPVFDESLSPHPLHVEVRVRCYSSAWLASIYEPLGRIESSIAKKPVSIQSSNELHSRGP